MDDLRAALLNYDGKSTAILAEIEHRFKTHENYPQRLVALFSDENGTVADGATWLLKAFVEMRGDVLGDVIKDLVEVCPKTKTWAAQLHICQTISMLDVGEDDARRLGNWVQGLLDHKRPFVRAWSLDALVALAKQAQDLQANAADALQTAAQDPAASVRARARNLDLSG